MTAPLLLSAAARTDRPWKNGGGTTQEVVAVPPGSGMDDFDWRISIAEVTSDGAFSPFPGVDRHLMVLAGRISLTNEDGQERIVEAGDQPASFPGDRPTFGRPIGGPVRDLNLMVRRTAYVGSMRRVAAGTFAGDADVTVIVSLDHTVLSAGAVEMTLAPLDSLVFRGGATLRSDGPLAVAEIRTLEAA